MSDLVHNHDSHMDSDAVIHVHMESTNTNPVSGGST